MPRKMAHVKLRHEDRARKIEATRVKEDEYKRLVIYNGEDVVVTFPLDKIEDWCLEEEGPITRI